MDIKIVGEQEEIKSVEPGNPKIEVSPPDEILKYSVGSLFDFKPTEMSQYSDKIGTLITWAKTQTDDHSPENIKWTIRNLGIKLGSPALGEKMINYLTRFAYLAMEKDKLEEQLDKYNPKHANNN